MTPDEILENGVNYVALFITILPYIIAGATAFLASMLKSEKKGLAKWVEGLSCSSLSTAVVGLLSHYGWGDSASAVFVGTFIGFMGSDYMVLIFKRLANWKFAEIGAKNDDSK